MEDEFISLVGKALELIRKRDMLSLGKHEIARLTVVHQQARPGDPPVLLARLAMTILGQLLDSKMRPEGPRDFDRIDWRRYLLLQEYVFRGRTMGEIMADLGISQALFFDTKRQAIETLANELWAEEQRSREEVERIPHNIPPAHFDFIPRADEMGTDLVELILAGFRKRPWVVSVRGFGGVGKTTLAIEAAWAAIRQGLFNRVTWVDIRPDQAQSPDLLGHILDTIGKELGTRKVLTVEDMDERRKLVMGPLSEVKALIVIDSTENVPDEQHERITEFIRDLPLPTCALLTSREMVRKTELEAMIHLEGMRQEEALKFLKARANEHAIHLDEQQTLYLAETTRGNPRAMLWALGWMRKYGLPAKDVLNPEMPDMSELLENLLGRVYEKLDTDEEKVLNALSLYTGPVNWDAIAAASGLQEWPARVKMALGSLHSRFLVDVERKQERRLYSIAPLTQMFLRGSTMKPGGRIAGQSAREFLLEARERMIEYCIETFRQSKPYERLRFVKAHRQTIIMEMEWCYKHGWSERLTDLVFFTGKALGDLGYWRDRLAWGQRGVEAAKKIGNLKRATWHKIFDVGWTYMQLGDWEKAREITKEALTKAQKSTYAEAECIGLRNLGLMAIKEGDRQKAVEYFERSLHIAEVQELPEWIALAKTALGSAKLGLGEASEARRLLGEAHSAYVSLGNPEFISMSLTDMARAALEYGELDKATELLDRSLSIAQHIPDPSRAYAYGLRVQGMLWQKQGNTDNSRECLEQSLDISARLGQVIRVKETQRLIDDLEQQSKSNTAA